MRDKIKDTGIMNMPLQSVTQLIVSTSPTLCDARFRRASSFSSPWPLSISCHAATSDHDVIDTKKQRENRKAVAQIINRSLSQAAQERQSGNKYAEKSLRPESFTKQQFQKWAMRNNRNPPLL